MTPRGTYFLYWGVFLAMLAAPAATANHPEAGDNTFTTTTYHLAQNGTVTQDITTTTVLLTFNFTDTPGNDFNITSHLLIIEVAGTGIYRADSTGSWLIETDLDGTVIPECTYRIATFNSGVLGGDLPVVPHHDTACGVELDGDGVNGGQHTVNVTVSIDTGSPATLENYNTHVEIIRQDEYMLGSEITITNLTEWLPLTLLIVVFAISLWQGYTFPLTISAIGIALQYFDTPPIAFVGIVYLLIVAFLLEYFVGGLRGLMKRDKQDDDNPW